MLQFEDIVLVPTVLQRKNYLANWLPYAGKVKTYARAVLPDPTAVCGVSVFTYCIVHTSVKLEHSYSAGSWWWYYLFSSF